MHLQNLIKYAKTHRLKVHSLKRKPIDASPARDRQHGVTRDCDGARTLARRQHRAGASGGDGTWAEQF